MSLCSSSAREKPELTNWDTSPQGLCRSNTGSLPGLIVRRLFSMRSPGILTARYKLVTRRFLQTLVLTLGLGPLQCATLERLSLDDMIVKSTAIVRGKVTATYAALSGPIVYTHYNLQV